MAVTANTNSLITRSGLLRIAAGSIIALLLVYVSAGHMSAPHIALWSANQQNHQEVAGPSCPTTLLVNDILVVFKTGSTEHHRVPVHLDTDLSCPPHIVAGSDAEEDIAGLHLEDVLTDIDEETKNAAPEFSFYRRLHNLLEFGQSLDQVPRDQFSDGSSKEDGQAWKLDKWKFLPLLQKAVAERPSAKWYVFVEADTYLVWPNIVSMLARFDHTQPRYLGSANFFGDREFAHGGSGYVLSQHTAHAASWYLQAHPERVTEMVESECCGDLIISLLLKELGTDLTAMAPTIQGETPTSQDYVEGKWCSPVATFHHMSPDDISGMWQYEQSRATNLSQLILHRDVYDHFVRPHLRPRIDGWDNLSSEEESLAAPGDPAGESFEACRDLCGAYEGCLQFSWKLGECNTSPVIRFGGATQVGSLDSGFMLDRIDKFTNDLGLCSTPQWPAGQDEPSSESLT